MDETPVPAPRSKKPVPSPRNKNANEEKEKSKQTLQHSSSIRKKLKSMTENVQEGTKLVGSKIEKSVKDILKRTGSIHSEDAVEEQTQPRPLSLQSPDVFKDISFGSPLDKKSRSLSPSRIDGLEVSYDEPGAARKRLFEPEPVYVEMSNLSNSKESSDASYEELQFVGESFSEALSAEMTKIFLKVQSDDGSSSNALESDEIYEELYPVNREEAQYAEVKKPSRRNKEVTSTHNKPQRIYENWDFKKPEKPCIPPETGSIVTSSTITEPKEDSYENWNILPLDNSFPPDVSVFNDVIQEFDPLFEPRAESTSGSNSDLGVLSIPDIEIPIPPERQDSLRNIDSSTEEEAEEEEASSETPDAGEHKILARLSKLVLKKVADGSNWSSSRLSKKGVANLKHSIRCDYGSPHSGYLVMKPANSIERYTKKWCQLSSGSLGLSSDRKAPAKEWISLEKVLSIQIPSGKLNFEGEELDFFELSVKGRSKPHVLGCDSHPTLRLWTQAILKALSPSFPSELASSYSRAGWCFLKEGINRSWKHAWLVIDKRTLYYCRDRGNMKEIDLRKAVLIELKTDWDESFNDLVERGPCVLLGTTDKTLYMFFDNQKEAKEWKHAIKSAAVKNGSFLEDQQMTKDECPVIIDKCINFIYAYGLMSPGIYRKSGSKLKISRLLADLRKDSWAVQLSPQEYTEYDVSCALKKFFQDLPQPLFGHNLHPFFFTTSGLSTEEGKIESYRRGLEQLSPVNYVTAKRLIGHLHAIQEQSEKNLMHVDNLAAIWSPTLMQAGTQGVMTFEKRECDVITDLIVLYEKVFDVDKEELAREERFREAVEKTMLFTNSVQKPSGDFKIGFYIGNKAGACVSLNVTPRCTAGEVCVKLCNKTEFEAHELCLMEVLLNGSLTRPLHHTERVLDIVTRWGDWDPSDRRDNYLAISPNTVYRELKHLLTLMASKSGDLKYADRKSKSFKTFTFEFSHAKLVQFKEKTCQNKVAEWDIENIIWYMGYEPKRNPHDRWAITFICKNQIPKRTKEEPFFGHTISGSTREDSLGWMASFLLSLYSPADLFPPRDLV